MLANISNWILTESSLPNQLFLSALGRPVPGPAADASPNRSRLNVCFFSRLSRTVASVVLAEQLCKA